MKNTSDEKRTHGFPQIFVRTLLFLLVLIPYLSFAGAHANETVILNTDDEADISGSEEKKISNISSKAKIYLSEGTVIVNIGSPIEVVSIKPVSQKNKKRIEKALPVPGKSPTSHKTTSKKEIKPIVSTKYKSGISSEFLFSPDNTWTGYILTSQNNKVKSFGLKSSFSTILFFFSGFSRVLYPNHMNETFKDTLKSYHTRPPPAITSFI
ncbi:MULTISPECIES: hypothetical protein [Chryseobacterium]|uniref:hypothetical protein n=1 Tax=Chryseobacterium TaxID=59732 RepID=UPI0012970347|nr:MULTISPECIES: hypothetical protein [Chryseobacterium]MDR6919696.1 hypothetical protein [Chryseobacterium sp. 2987]